MSATLTSLEKKVITQNTNTSYQDAFLEVYKKKVFQFLQQYRKSDNPESPWKLFFRGSFDYRRMDEMVEDDPTWEEGYRELRRTNEAWHGVYDAIREINVKAMRVMEIHWNHLLQAVSLPVPAWHDVLVQKYSSYMFPLGNELKEGKIWKTGHVVINRTILSGTHYYEFYTGEGYLLFKSLCTDGREEKKNYEQNALAFAQELSRTLVLKNELPFVVQYKAYEKVIALKKKYTLV